MRFEVLMYRVLVIALAMLVPHLCCGCMEGRLDQEGQSVSIDRGTHAEKRDSVLTADIAKRVLLEMDGRQIPAGVIVPLPADDAIKVVNVDEITVGPYHCNLKAKTFIVTAEYPDAPRHKFNELSGVFECDGEGVWRAKVTHNISGG